ncbi:MAG: acetate--CoA ligase family protein, partial [Proteobacteria bacterium]|nr:acetate--CoA ligase family protein [Pseudomonadota bacterium]
MYVHEFQAKELLKQSGVPVPLGIPMTSVAEVKAAYHQLTSHSYHGIVAVKAQIHAGGRGEAGGVKIVKSLTEAEDATRSLLGSTLVTRQTGVDGKMVHTVYLEAGCHITSEYYLSFSVDRSSGKVALLFSAEGGMDIEDVAEKHPEKLVKLFLDYDRGIASYHTWQLQHLSALPPSLVPSLHETLVQLFKVFKTYDLLQLEINPLALLSEQSFTVLDAKL